MHRGIPVLLKLNLTFRAKTSQEIGPGTAAGSDREFRDTLLERGANFMMVKELEGREEQSKKVRKEGLKTKERTSEESRNKEGVNKEVFS
jgi:hypothetical protein